MAGDDSQNQDGTQPPADDAGTQAGSGAEGAGDSTLASRYAGQTAKVNALTGERDALKAERDALAAKLAEAEKGVLDKDEALRNQLAAKDKELAEVRRERALALVEAKYPETFAEFGELVAEWPAEKLAAAEARLSGGAGETEPPTPGRHNESRTQVPPSKSGREETADEIEARLLAMPDPYST